MPLSRDQILARSTAGRTEQVQIGDGPDDHVIIRGLTRNEALTVQDLPTTIDKDNFMLSTALVDPVLSVADVAAWADADDAGVLVKVSEAIVTLSGMGEGAGKSGVARTRKR